MALSDVDIWFQDETRIGQQGSLTRVWHYKGERPRITRQAQFLSTYIYGAVCPQTGDSVGLICPYTNKECMRLFMEEVSKHVPEGRYAVLILDGASWHQPDLHQSNVGILTIPPYSPELNPMEQVWQYMKQHWLSNRCYKDYDEIVEVACQAWNKLAELTETLKSITRRTWATV